MPAMGKSIRQKKPSHFSTYRLLSIVAISAILIHTIWKFTKYESANLSNLTSLPNIIIGCPQNVQTLLYRHQDPPDETFYDDPETHHYTIDKPMINWDEKRKEWLKHHPTFSSRVENRVLLITGSQPEPCANPIGDHMLFRFFKNKVDYCRTHGYDIFYNNAFLHPKMESFWAKIPIIRAAMVAHPEKEWIFWVDSDAVFTDMEFKLPLEKFKDYNLVVNGWLDSIYEKKSWVALNAGVFLIRNCQWSMDLMDVWASLGPKSPDYKKWGEIQRSTFKDKMFRGSDDQSALIYLLLKEKEKWGGKVYVQDEYSFSGYWLEIVRKFENMTKKYKELEKGVSRLRRRHAEVVSESYAVEEEELRRQLGEWRRPFITHFTGCQPCSGDHNPAYKGDSCWVEIERALNFADNQVLRNYGFMHPDIANRSVAPLHI